MAENSITEKLCTTCKVIKPTTEFYRLTSAKDGYRSLCKLCSKISCERSKLNVAERKKLINITEKRCTDCGEMQPISEYRFNVRYGDGFTNWCRLCRNAYQRKRRDEITTPETLRVHADGMAKLNKRRLELGVCVTCGEPRTDDKTRCESCRTKHNKGGRALRQQRKRAGLCITCKEPQWEHSTTWCFRCHIKEIARKALGSSGQWNVLLDILKEQEYKCAYSGEPLTIGVNASIDHIYPKSTYPEMQHDLDNIQWVTLDVNSMKRALEPDRFLNLVQQIYRHSCAQAISEVMPRSSTLSIPQSPTPAV